MTDTLADTMQAWYASQLGHQGSVIELEREYFQASANETWADAALDFYASANGSNPVGSLNSEIFKYYSNLSGLTPAANYSTADHMTALFGGGGGHGITPPISDQLEAFFSADLIDGYSTDNRVSKNLLTINQSSVETDLTGWVAINFCTIARSTAQALHGVASVAMTVTGAASNATAGNGAARVPVVAGRTYTLVCDTIGPAAKLSGMFGTWYDASGSVISNLQSGTATGDGTTWKKASTTVVAPANAVSVDVKLVTGTVVGGEVFYFDKIGIWEGSSTDWVLPGKLHNINLLSYDQATLENSFTGWNLIGGSPTFVRSTAASASGSASGLTTLTTAAGSSYGTASVPVTPGKTYTAHVKIREASGTGLTARVYLGWYNSSDVNISLTDFTSITTTAAFQAVTKTAVAPVGAVYARVISWLTGAIGNATYSDEYGLWEGGQTEWVPPYRTDRPVDGEPISFWREMSGKNRHAIQNTVASQPLYRKSATAASKNMLTPNQASWETDTTGAGGTTNAAVSRITTQQLHGNACLQVSSNSAAYVDSALTPTTGIIPGRTYTAVVSIKSAVITVPANIRILWRDSGGSILSTTSGALINLTTGWQQYIVTGVAPANAASATPFIAFTATGVANLIYLDQYGLWEGSTTGWEFPGVPSRNLLSYNQATAWTDVIGNTPGGIFNTQGTLTVTRSTALGPDVPCWRGTLGAAAPCAMGVPQGLNAIPVVAGRTYTGHVKVRSGLLTLSCHARVLFYDSVGTQVGGSNDGAAAALTTSFVPRTVTAVAPVGAVYANIVARISAGGAAADTYDMDDLSLTEGSDVAWKPPVTLPNNKATVQFDGVDDTLVGIIAALNVTSLSVYAAVSADHVVASHRRIWQITGGVGLVQYLNATSGAHVMAFNASIPTAAAVTIAVAAILSAISTATDSQAFTNGAGGTVNTTDPAGVGGTVMNVGGVSGNLFAGGIAAILIYSGTHTTAQRQQIERWLGARYGVSVV